MGSRVHWKDIYERTNIAEVLTFQKVKLPEIYEKLDAIMLLF